MSSTTPHLGLTLPGPLSTIGPEWATDINADLSTIDSHNHTETTNQVPSAGININADLSYTGFGPINMAYARFTAGAIPSAGTLVSSLFVNSGNLYYQNGSGTNIQLTSGSTIGPSAATASNGFTAAPGSFNAGQALFNTASNTYEFYTDAAHTTLAYIYGDRVVLNRSGGQGLFMATSGSSATPLGGWALSNAANSCLLGFDDGSGAYNIPAFSVYPAGVTDSYKYGFNAGTAPTYVLDARLNQTLTNSQLEMLSLALGSTAGGAVSTGYGPGIVFRANTNSAAPSTYLRQGAIRGFWSTVGTVGGVRIHGAASGTQSATAGIEVINDTGTDYVGIGTAAAAGTGLKISGTVTMDNSLGVTGAVTIAATTTGNSAAGLISQDNIVSNRITYNGTTDTIVSKFNVPTVTKNSTGNYTFNFNRTLNGNATCIWIGNATTFTAVSGGAGSGSLRITNGGGSDDIVQLIVAGGR